MIVDDIEDYPESEAMRGVDQRPEIVRAAIEPRGRKQIDAVVSPTKLTGKVGDRHDLEDGDAKFGKMGQLRDRRPKGTLLGERTDVEFIKYISFGRHTGPSRIGPDECVGVDDFRGAHWPFRLKPRGRIGQ